MDMHIKKTKINQLIESDRILRQEEYEMQTSRYQANLEMLKVIKSKFDENNTPEGINQLLLHKWRIPSNVYVVFQPMISGYCPGQYFSTKYIVSSIGPNGDPLKTGLAIVVEERTGREFAIVRECFAHSTVNKPIPDLPEDLLPWSAPLLSSSANNTDSFLFPLAGQIFEEHPAFKRMMEFANAVMAEEHPQARVLFRIMKLQENTKNKRDMLEAQALGIALDGRNADDMREKYPLLAKRIKQADWTYEESDNAFVYKLGRQEEKEILAQLSAIPVDDALAIWHLWGYSPMDYCTWWRMSKLMTMSEKLADSGLGANSHLI